jgi:hypothetical protein
MVFHVLWSTGYRFSTVTARTSTVSVWCARARGKDFRLYLMILLVNNYRGRVRVEDRVPGDHKTDAGFVAGLPPVPSVKP